MKIKSIDHVLLGVLLLCALVSSSDVTMGATCSSLNKVEIYYKNYFDFYLAKQYATYSGLFYNVINQAVKTCCPTTALQYRPINSTDSIEEIVHATVLQDSSAPEDGVIKLYYPEFIDRDSLVLYHSTTPFIRLSKSPGHAIVMLKPPPKKPVFVGEIFVKSWAILIFLVAFATVIGILAWMTDHHCNPKDFPNPFYVGIFEGFWWSVVTMTTVGYGDKAPKGAIARVLAVFWIMVSTVFLALFTANATTILAISQAEEDYSITLGKRVGVLNSKHFVEVELNLGSTLLEYTSTLDWASAAIQTKDVDRLIFPNYLDFLLFVKDETYKELFKNSFVLTNAIKHPFQIGLAVAANNANLTLMENHFVICMRAILHTRERAARKMLDLSLIEFTENTNTKNIKTALDNDNLLVMSYYFFGIIVFLVTIGLSWDYYEYRKRTRAGESSPQDGAVEMVEIAYPEFDDVVLNSQSGDVALDGSGHLAVNQSGHLAVSQSGGYNMDHRVSISQSYNEPTAYGV